MRIALVYDCLYPYTVGGAELWLRTLAERLAHEHEVTYITRRQWGEDAAPDLPGVEVVAVSGGRELYDDRGRRRLLPPVRFAGGVFAHLLRRRGRYDLVHCLSYPYLSVIAARAALAGRRPRFVVEWLEVLSAGWWRSYAGPAGGALGRALQALCVRLTPEAVVFSRHSARMLEAAGARGPIHRLPGLCAESAAGPRPAEEPRFVLFAGRHVPDKRPVAVVEALAIARRERPDLRAVVAGDGPERPRVLRRVAELGLEAAVEAPGFMDGSALARLRAGAACAVSASVREGYGMAVLEAAAAGTPVVACRAPDNGAVELVQPGVNGELAESPRPEDIAAAILRVLDAGPELRRRAADWFAERSDELSMERSLDRLAELYSESARTAS